MKIARRPAAAAAMVHAGVFLCARGDGDGGGSRVVRRNAISRHIFSRHIFAS